MLTEQVKAISERSQGGKKWDHLEKYKNLKLFDGKQHDFEEWNMKSEVLYVRVTARSDNL